MSTRIRWACSSPSMQQRNAFTAKQISWFSVRYKMVAKNTQRQSLHSSARISRLAARIPNGTWDTHMHVVDPRIFPLDKAAQYQPSPHTMQQATAFLDQLGIKKMVIVQPSIYGNDNACTLDGLQKLGPKLGRAVIQFDPAVTSKSQLQEWHDLGVRGVRLNFKSVGANPTSAELEKTMHLYADAVRPLNWVLELYIAMENIPLLETAIKKLKDTKICIDHFGHPTVDSLSTAQSAHQIPGFESLVRILKDGNIWVKISASYRLQKDPDATVVKSLCKEILRVRPDRCVFATDWPHTRFENLEVDSYLEKILDWCEEENVSLETVLVKNAEELFDAK